MTDRIVLAMTGATGQVYAIRGLELAAGADVEVHLIVSRAAKMNLKQETDVTLSTVTELADVTHDNRDIGASLSSGSFSTTGMIVVPCSMKTLSNIATGDASNLITRAADVTLKERRPLVLLPREKPLNRIHLENMLTVTDAGAIVYPPFPSFYQQPDSIDDIVTRTMARALTYLGVEGEFKEWDGLSFEEE